MSLSSSSDSIPQSSDTQDSSRTHFDVRQISCQNKHALIFQRWGVMEPGEHFVLVNDHDPVPLYHQFARQFPDAFTWEYLIAGPDVFHVKITRLKATPEPVRRTFFSSSPAPENQAAAVVADPSAVVVSNAAVVSEIDARGLEPPEPMLRILAGVEALAAGGVLRARTDRLPMHLLPELEARGLRHESEEQPDGSWITTLRRC